MGRLVQISFVVFCFCLRAHVVTAQVVNLGYPGANTAELDSKFGDALSLHPNWVVLFAGANDALNPAKLLPVEVSREHVLHMVVGAQGAGARVVLVSVHDPDLTRLFGRHQASDYGDIPPDRRNADLNKMLHDVASERHARLADFNAALQAKGGANDQWSTDGLHLTRAGYALLASTVRAALPRHLHGHQKVVCFGDSLTYGIGVRAPGGAPETVDTYPSQLGMLLK